MGFGELFRAAPFGCRITQQTQGKCLHSVASICSLGDRHSSTNSN
jgi:hypothetical protein